MDNIVQKAFSSKKSVYIILLVSLILLFCVFVYLWKYSSFFNKTNTSVTTIPLDQRNPDEQLGILKSRGIVEIPEAQNNVSVSISEFPKEILSFFGPGLSGLTTSSADFADGKKGFVADFSTTTKDARAIVQLVANKGSATGWKLTSALYSQNSVLVGVENENYKASIEGTLYSNTETSIHIILIKK
jgi:hypothetical protein